MAEIRKIFWFALGLLCWAIVAPAESLDRLEEIVARYSSLSAFLADPQGIADYRDAYRKFLGELPNASSDQSFDDLWLAFEAQLRQVNEKVPGFGQSVWRANPNWRDSEFKIQGESKGSGLVARREALLDAVKVATDEAVINSQRLHAKKEKARVSGVQTLASDLTQRFAVLAPEAVKRLSRAEKKAYDIRIGGDRKTGQRGLADDANAQFLAAYLTSFVLQENEGLRDYLLSGDPDMTKDGLARLARLENFSDFFAERGMGDLRTILPYLRYSSPALDYISREYTRGRESMQKFRGVKDAAPTEALRVRLQQLQAEGVAEDKIRTQLSPPLVADYDTWLKESALARQRKAQVKAEFRSPLFNYLVFDDPIRRTSRLQADAPMNLTYVASPRPFHLLLAGRKNNECVGGGNCRTLVPKRWARAAFEGDRSLFSLNPDGSLEGFIGLTQVAKEGDPKPFWILDLGSRATKGEIIFKNIEGRPVKYTFFDALIDKLSASPEVGSVPRFIISDGETVSANVAGSELVQRSQAYNELKRVGGPGEFRPVDPMASAITREFPQTLNGYGGGGMIYDGMPNDGKNVYELVPMRDRKRWTKEELEFELFREAPLKSKGNERIWLKAFESGVRLASAKHYQDPETAAKFFETWVAKWVYRHRLGGAGANWEADLARLEKLDGFLGAKSHPSFAEPSAGNSHPLRQAGLIELLAGKIRENPGSALAEKLIGLNLMTATADSAVTDGQIRAGLAVLSSPDATLNGHGKAAQVILSLVPRAAELPSVIGDEVIEAMRKAVLAPGPADGSLYADRFALSYFARAIAEFPHELRLVSPAVAQTLADALEKETQDRLAMAKRQPFLATMVQTINRLLDSRPEAPELQTKKVLRALERYFTGVKNGADQELTKFTNRVLSAKTIEPEIHTSPLLALLDDNSLTSAILANPTESRLQTDKVWMRLAEDLVGPHPEGALAAFNQLMLVHSDSPAFTHEGLIARLTKTPSVETSPLRQFIIRRNRHHSAFADSTYLSRVFDQDIREEMRLLLESPATSGLEKELRRTVTRRLGLVGIPDPAFFDWLFDTRLSYRDAKNIAEVIVDRFSYVAMNQPLLHNEAQTDEQKSWNWLASAPSEENLQLIRRYQSVDHPAAEKFLIRILGDAMARTKFHSRDEVSAFQVAEEISRLVPGSYLDRIAKKSMLFSRFYFPALASLSYQMSLMPQHPFMATYLNDLEEGMKSQVGDVEALNEFGERFEEFARKSSGINREKALEKIRVVQALMETQGAGHFKCYAKLKLLVP